MLRCKDKPDAIVFLGEPILYLRDCEAMDIRSITLVQVVKLLRYHPKRILCKEGKVTN